MQRITKRRISTRLDDRHDDNGDDDDERMDVDQEEESDQPPLSLPRILKEATKELEYIKTCVFKRRTAQHRRDLRQGGTLAATIPLAMRMQQLQQPEQKTVAALKNDDDYRYNDADGGGGDHDDFAYGGDFHDDGDDHDGDDELEGNGPADFNNSDNNAGLSSVLDAIPHQHSTNPLTLSPSNSRAPTFDELCRAHIQVFAKKAQRFATETQLTQRVSAWQAKLGPLLQDEETRPVFDIYNYSSQVIAAMQQELDQRIKYKSDNEDTPLFEKPNVVDFQVVTRDCPDYDVCRLFLASLSLANSGNVELCPTTATETPMGRSLDSLSMELISADMSQPMENYLAPSAAAKVATATAMAQVTTTATTTRQNPRKRMLEA